MIILPGENGSHYATNSETGEKLFYEPEPEINMNVMCRVKSASIAGLDLEILEINGEKVTIEYKAVHKPSFINQDEESKFLDDEFKLNDIIVGVIEDFCDVNGILIGNIVHYRR